MVELQKGGDKKEGGDKNKGGKHLIHLLRNFWIFNTVPSCSYANFRINMQIVEIRDV